MKQLKVISIVWGMLLLSIFLVLTFFALKWKSQTTPYFELEKNLVNATKSYYESAYSYPEKGNIKKVTYDELKESEAIESLSVDDDECDGYVIVSHNNVIEYDAYLKCNNYTTKNYDKYNK